MTQWALVVRQFGEQLGMPELIPSVDGQFALQLESGRRIAAEAVGSEFLVYASDPAPYESARRLLRLWRNAYVTRLESRPIQAALREHDGSVRLLAVVRLQASECSVYALRAAIDLVSRCLDGAQDH